MGLVVLLWFHFSAACLTYVVADDKGHPPVLWVLLALFFGPFALIAIAGMGDRDLRRQIQLMAEKQSVDLSPKQQGGDSSPKKLSY